MLLRELIKLALLVQLPAHTFGWNVELAFVFKMRVLRAFAANSWLLDEPETLVVPAALIGLVALVPIFFFGFLRMTTRLTLCRFGREFTLAGGGAVDSRVSGFEVGPTLGGCVVVVSNFASEATVAWRFRRLPLANLLASTWTEVVETEESALIFALS